jgi:predicted DNA binding CopG/RHH family protein
MSIKEMFKKIFTNKTDAKVDELNRQSLKKIDDSARVAKRHAELLKKNGVGMRIFIATGGDHHG